MNEQEFNENVNSVIIKPINHDTVHRICSGQVVVNLAIAMKELVENAIDAGATKIEVRLKEYGSELIEVSDDGSGVPRENFQALTLKHYTSKLRVFDDLESVTTLGFRGEALSSLCALSDLTVTTRHVMAEHGTKIEYDHSGRIISETPCARSCGTTVSLSNLFSTLPVRRREFTKNLKKEYNKMCQLLYAYCLVSTGIKLTCSNQTSKGSKSTVVSTQGSLLVRDNIISVFGPKQISTLVDVMVINPEEITLQEFGVSLAPGEKFPFEFECFVSSVMHGSGRSAADRQFYYINSRPFEPNKVMKLVNQVYKQFNGNQYPFVYLNILTEKKNIDVNVTPDKRQILLEEEKLLLATIKSSLIDAFKNFPCTYKVEGANSVPSSQNQALKRSLSATNTADLFETFKKKSKTNLDVSDKPSPEVDSDNKTQKKQSSLINNKNFKVKLAETTCKDNDTTFHIDTLVCKLNRDVKATTLETVEQKQTVTKIESKDKPVDILPTTFHTDTLVCKLNRDVKTTTPETVEEKQTVTKIESIDKPVDILAVKIENENASSKCAAVKVSNLKDVKMENKPGFNPNKVNINVTTEQIKEMLDKRRDSEIKENISVRFRSQICPDSNKQAEQELQKQISKDDFKKMDVIGQFNLGFIIVKLENDLFIIDQHATDEKYNFEQLQLTTVLETQVLVSPKPLELTAASEDLLMENEEIFKKNGFTFSIDHEAEATRKIKLTSIPLSKNVIFGKDDIDELLFMLQDANNMMCRPSKVRNMFASRACRKSVMIGDALTHSAMKKLVEHMGNIEQPWNCPHGRPTMRHLINLNLINKHQ